MTNDLLAPSTGELSPMQKAEKLVKLAALKKQVTEAYNQLRDDLLQITQELDVYTLKTGSYTISRAKKITPSVTDVEELKAALDERDIPYKMKEVFADFMAPVFKQLVEQGTELSGLEGKVTEYVSVRVAKPKESHE